MMQEKTTIYLDDYKPSNFAIKAVNLEFDLFETHADVTNRMLVQTDDKTPTSLVLMGEDLELLSIKCDGKVLSEEQYASTDTSLEINALSKAFELEIVTRIYPHENTSLEGLYMSGDIFCTQNEPEGFRHITYYLDRPDVMSIFTTKVIADKKSFPTLLSNGNFVESGDLENGRHFALWHDPFVKPCYLFALVAGDLGVISDTFITMSGREIDLNIYCDKGNEPKCYHAMTSLKAAMKWDEEVYGREYDLEIYNIVAVDSFNMGAMENKGLNIFNSHYVLASQETATDQNFMGIESVIAHEYFHNWTGNRITCRDWFQLTLKEGLTVFRDQNFSADMNSEVVQRISDVTALRERQFVEDAGPTAHPIKPKSYIEINNFYTATVYEKGAEVIRMLHTLLGKEKFRKATDLYFETFDGQAVRTEDFLWAMRQSGEFDLEAFSLWYDQERTPQLEVTHHYDANKKVLDVTLTQQIPKDVNNRMQSAYMYPLAIALLDAQGHPIALECSNKDQHRLDDGILIVSKDRETFSFINVPQKPYISVNRNFSAPIKVIQKDVDHAFFMAHERDGFNRFEAAQTYALQVMEEILNEKEVDDIYLDTFGHCLKDDTIDNAFKAQLLSIPTLNMMMQGVEPIDVMALSSARFSLEKAIALRHKDEMLAQYHALHEPSNNEIDAVSMGKRALKNVLLSYLMNLHDSAISTLCHDQYYGSLTMTDRIKALDLLENYEPSLGEGALRDFYARYSNDTLVMNKYFAVLAASEREGCIDRVQALEKDPAFDIRVPNLVRSLFGVFARNHLHFHAKDGHGYSYIAEKIIYLDTINPQIASGLAGAFKLYDKMNEHSKAQMKMALEKILKAPNLSSNVYEIVEKILH